MQPGKKENLVTISCEHKGSTGVRIGIDLKRTPHLGDACEAEECEALLEELLEQQGDAIVLSQLVNAAALEQVGQAQAAQAVVQARAEAQVAQVSK